jgi:hypothetical protein
MKLSEKKFKTWLKHVEGMEDQRIVIIFAYNGIDKRDLGRPQ